ncbi:hypothetical protein [Nocardia vermiculata]|uniref:Uncharacterized protein n=1 Tax=Nocardia vermiculata TaxID=257274 RepID=A0A846Y9J1_9NOCA|nr:hypothetical protein [Nocardia vermiculata]NKY54502.1 hypothetical protein [Nocardia vermiculata]
MGPVIVVVIALLLLAAFFVASVVAPAVRTAHSSDDAGKRQAALEVLETMFRWRRTTHRNGEKEQ